jgi:hypothetical protein
MSYQINKSNGDSIIVLDGTKDTTSTSLTLIGRKSLNYGQYENQNFVRLLENFAYTLPPVNAITGQLWYNTSNQTLNLYNTQTWKPLATEEFVANLFSNSTELANVVVTNYVTTYGYSDSNVAAYIPTDPSFTILQANVAALSLGLTAANAYSVSTNATTQAAITSLNSFISVVNTQLNSSISSISANIGAFETYANISFDTKSTTNSIQANIGAFETYANLQFLLVQGNTATITNQLVSYELYANAQMSSIQGYVNSVNSNVGTLASNLTTFETYANLAFGPSSPSSYSNSNVAAYLPTDPTIKSIQANIGAFENYANTTFTVSSYNNSNVASYLPSDPTITTIQANIGAFETYANTQIRTQSNLISNINANIGAFETYANATFSTSGGSSYGNTNVAAYLPSYTGNVSANYVTANRFNFANGVNILSTVSGGSGALPSRTTVTVSTGNLSAGASANINVAGYKGYALYAISTTANAWVTVYSSNSSLSSDYSRSITTDPSPGSGVIAEMISTTGSATQYFTPAVVGFNTESPVTTNIPIKVYNNGGTGTISVTLTLLQTES